MLMKKNILILLVLFMQTLCIKGIGDFNHTDKRKEDMMQNSILVHQRYEKFVKKVSDTEIVYALKNKEGYATSSSVHFEDENGNPIGLICFWGEMARAKSCIKKEWKSYKVVEIPLTEFIENWCIGMENDDLLMGIEFDQNMYGFEAEPLEVILDLVKEVKLLGKDLKFRNFKGVTDLEKKVKAIIKH